MPLFDLKNFNGEVFQKYSETTPNLRRNELIKSGAIVEKPTFASLLPEQVGGNYIITPMRGRIGGEPDNYDGSTDIKADKRGTFTQGRIVIGRAHGWTEKDFSADITGEDFTAAAYEVAEYWDDVDQETILATLKGIFLMSGEGNDDFVKNHTYTEGLFNETTLNNAIQQSAGDGKERFALAIMHSLVATHLENLKLMSYLKYTDANGIQRDLRMATLNGLTVLIDDNVPVEDVPAKYVRSSAGAWGALKVVESGAGANEIEKSEVESDIEDINEGEYVMYMPAGKEYTTYVFANGAIEYTNVGAKVPFEMWRDPKSDGGTDILYSRQRKIFAPVGISFINTGIISPTKADLETGSNWTLANSNEPESPKYYPEKAIGIARIITRG